jgi:hypothetical protein
MTMSSLHHDSFVIDALVYHARRSAGHIRGYLGGNLARALGEIW